MKLKKSSFFYLFVLFFVGLVYYFEIYQVEKDEAQKSQEALFVKMPKEEIVRLTLTQGDQVLELEKQDQVWKVVKPVEDSADPESMAGWIDSLITEKSTKRIGEGETFDWKTYGLEKPMAQLVFESSKGQKETLFLGTGKTIDGNPFIKKNEEAIVHVGSTLLRGLFEKKAIDVREKKILRDELAGIEGFVLEKDAAKGKEKIDLTLEKARWILKDHASWNLEENEVREFVSLVRNLKAMDFVLENEPNAAQTQQYGLKNPAMKVTYRLQGGKEWQGFFGQDKEKNWYFSSGSLKKVAKLTTTDLDLLIKTKGDSLRDHSEPFAFAMDEVKKISLEGEASLALTKEGETWTAADQKKIDQQSVDEWLRRLRELRVAEFLDGEKVASDLEASKKEFVLRDGAGKNIFSLKVGRSFKKKSQEGEELLVYAKSSIFPDMIAIKETDLSELKAEALLSSPSKDEKKEQME